MNNKLVNLTADPMEEEAISSLKELINGTFAPWRVLTISFL
jgi:hypothetical protein